MYCLENVFLSLTGWSVSELTVPSWCSPQSSALSSGPAPKHSGSNNQQGGGGGGLLNTSRVQEFPREETLIYQIWTARSHKQSRSVFFSCSWAVFCFQQHCELISSKTFDNPVCFEGWKVQVGLMKSASFFFVLLPHWIATEAVASQFDPATRSMIWAKVKKIPIWPIFKCGPWLCCSVNTTCMCKSHQHLHL